MKKFVTVLMMIVVMMIVVMMIQFSAVAEIEPYGGYDMNDDFCEFVNNADITDATFYGGIASQEMWFVNGWHVVAECEGNNIDEVDNAQEAVMRVYDGTGMVVGDYKITHDDEGTQLLWDIVYEIYTGELQ